MSIDGIWKCTMNTPMGRQDVLLTLATSDSQLTGKLSGAMGEAPLQDGKVNGDTATWKCALTKPIPITLEFSAKLDSDTLSGEAKLGQFGKAAFSGTRA